MNKNKSKERRTLVVPRRRRKPVWQNRSSLILRSVARDSDEVKILNNPQLHPEKVELEDARMTAEQLKELAEALSVVSAQSSVLKERDELRTLMEENLAADEVGVLDVQIILSGLSS